MFIRFTKQLVAAVLNGRSLPAALGASAYCMFPVFLWIFTFKQVGQIPAEWRPTIHTELLPAINKVILSPIGVILLTIIVTPLAQRVYLSSDMQKPTSFVDILDRTRLSVAALMLFPLVLSVLDRLARLPISTPKDLYAFTFYGCLHFASPFIAPLFWFFAPPGVARAYSWNLGFQNLASVATHIVFPNAAPWFTDMYGAPPVEAPSYDTLGSPAGLIRIDRILNITLYSKAFKKSPVVFGALPSVHASSAICVSIYACRYFNLPGRMVALFYTASMLWSTMYLRHHYAIDLLAGAVYAGTAFAFIRETQLKVLDTLAEERALSNGFQRIFYGYKQSKPPTLPVQHAYSPLSVIAEEAFKDEDAKFSV